MRKRLTVLISAALMATVIPSHANAATPSPAGCTAADLQTGACLTAVVSGSMSPLEAAVSQAVKRGEEAKARHFVQSRKKVHHDATQTKLERMLQDRSSTQPTLINAPGTGTVSGYIHTLRDTPTYLYCGPSNCTQVGKLQVDIRMNITDYPRNLLSGDVDVVAGPVVDITYLDCMTRLDRNNLPDSDVFRWSNCTNAHNRDTYTSSAIIMAQAWNQGGTRTEKYFNRYQLKFKTSAGSRPEFGPFEWETKRWYIPSSGHPYFQV